MQNVLPSFQRPLVHHDCVNCTLPYKLSSREDFATGGKYFIWKGVCLMCVCMYVCVIYTYVCIQMHVYIIDIYIYIHAAALFAIAESPRNQQLQCVSIGNRLNKPQFYEAAFKKNEVNLGVLL